MKELLVFLPGMMCDARLFAPQLAAFSHHRTVSVVPIINHDSIKLLAEEVLAAAPEKFALLGLSMGGIVAMEVIRQAPKRISRLALLDTNPLAELPEVSANREPQIEAVRQGRLRSIMRDEMKPNYLSEGLDKTKILDLCMAMAETLGAEVFVRQSRALQTRPDQQGNLPKITVPTLILCGHDDRLCPLERHIMMRDLIPGAKLSVINNASHLPTLENPDDTNKAISQWLNQ
jgi:pimeloyl-ACP methyl ester carboxylesterase